MKLEKEMTVGDKRLWLLDYLIIKNCIIAENTNEHHILTKSIDLQEIMEWRHSWVLHAFKEIYKEVAATIKGDSNTDDSKLCPWCARKDSRSICEGCLYGEIHGKCRSSQRDSLYQVIRKNMIGCDKFFEIIYMNRERFVCLFPKEQKVKKPVALIKTLIEKGFLVTKEGNWKKKGELNFDRSMWQYCGKEKPATYRWHPEWLEEPKK